MVVIDAAVLNPPPAEIRLWPAEAPMSLPRPLPEKITISPDQTWNHHIRHVVVPILTVYAAPREHNSGIGVVICPGGSYSLLSWDKEGVNVAQWLQARGITGAILKYRLPAPGKIPSGYLVSLLDAQRAVRLLRERAGDFGVKTNRVGIWGFSAGGHLAACAATKFNEPVPSPIKADRSVSCRPDFCVLAYPVISMVTATHVGSRTNLLGRGASERLLNEFSCEKLVTKETPPTFLVHARDDTSVPFTNSVMFADACRAAGVPVELHLYDKGKHGFGLGVNGGEVTNWPAQLEIFLDRFR